MLQSFDPKIIAEHCYSLRASEEAGIPLFSANYLEALKKSKNASTLMQNLEAFSSWNNHSVLDAVVKFCNVAEATVQLAQFDDSIDTKQQITAYPIPSISHRMLPYETSTNTILAIQLNLQLQHFTLQKINNTQSLIQEKCQITSHCLQLLAVANTNHTIIYWYIPMHLVTHIVSNVLQHQTYLFQKGVQQVAIYPGIIISIDSALTVGLFSFLSEVSSRMILCHIDH